MQEARRILTARDIMATNLVTFRADQPIHDAIKALLKHGISGAPVFVDKWLYGIVREAPTSFKERLYATPVHRLFEDRDFVEALAVETQTPIDLGAPNYHRLRYH